MEQHHVGSMRRKHGQYAKDSVIRDPPCAGREVSKVVITSEEFSSLSVPCQCTKRAASLLEPLSKTTFNKNLSACKLCVAILAVFSI